MATMTEAQTGATEDTEPSSGHSASDLDKLYTEADEADKELFAEQRSNVLLASGDHYNKMRSNFFRRLRDSRSISQEQKIRLMKNHIGNICEGYVNQIVSATPGIGFEPAQSSELQDIKTADLNHSVWEYGREKQHLDEQIQNWAEDFVEIGEVITKIFYDTDSGEVVGQGPDGTTMFSGDLMFEEVFGFNFLVDPAATNWKKARHSIIRKMVYVKKLKKMFPDAKPGSIEASSDQTYTIFERGKGAYQRSKDQCLVREFFFRPCALYPRGYFYYSVKGEILAQGELPAGKYPIVFKAFKRLATRARGQSKIKTLRPYQAEINRSGSKIAEHQITLGDDKLLIQHGTKVTAGASLPGVRTVNYTGGPPTVMQGRDGSQFLNYMNAQITEMYNNAGLAEKNEEVNIQLDPYTLLFRSASQKKRFQLYIRRFEEFLKEVATLYLELARYHFTDDMIIGMVGRKERVNIAEFKNSDQLCYRIKIVAQSEDIETKLGKQLSMTHILQYAGGKLDREDIGKLIKEMPYVAADDSFNDFTINFEAASNDILALDRGEQPPIGQYDDHAYMVKRLTSRMRQADFRFVSPQIQMAYAQRLQAHEQALAQQAQQIQMAEAGFIPTGGYLVTCDFYVQTDPNDPSKTRRVRMPSEALQWLIQKLETQGASQQQLENVNQENLAQIAQMTARTGGMQGMQPQQAQNQGAIHGHEQHPSIRPGYNGGSGGPISQPIFGAR